jgi:ribosome maturation protein Sdo1
MLLLSLISNVSTPRHFNNLKKEISATIRTSNMSKNLVVKYKKNGVNLEVLVVTGTMLPYRNGKMQVNQVLAVEEIFINGSKLEKAKQADVKKCCETDDKMQAIKLILDEGTFALNQKEMQEMQASRRREIINYLNKYYQDPRPPKPVPHPAERFDTLLTELKIKIDYTQSLNQQIRPIIRRLQESLPMKPMNPPHEQHF